MRRTLRTGLQPSSQLSPEQRLIYDRDSCDSTCDLCCLLSFVGLQVKNPQKSDNKVKNELKPICTMPQTCCVRKCRKPYAKNSGVTFHSVPRNMRELWLSALGLETLNWDAKPRVCSNHFTEDDFVPGGNVRKLRKGAIPTLWCVVKEEETEWTPSGNEAQELPTASTMAVIEKWEPQCPSTEASHQLEVLQLAALDTERSTELRTEPALSRDPLKELSRVWLNREANKTPKVYNMNTESVIPKRQDAADGQVTTVLAVMPTEVYQNPEGPPANPVPLEMGWIPQTTDAAEDDDTPVEMDSETHTISALEKEIKYLIKQNERLQAAIQPQAPFSLDKFAQKDKKILYYTGFHTYQLLTVVFEWILPSGDVKDLPLHAQADKNGRHHLAKLTAKDQFFLTLVRLRRGTPKETLEDMFSVSKSTVDNIFLCWINLLYFRLGCLNIWPDRDVLINRASESMKAKYPTIIGSLVCTEFSVQKSSSVQKQSEGYSNCKGASTLKSLMMIEPAGAIIYASPLFTGSISDKGIIISSGFLDILKEKVEEGEILPGDIILADKGFNVGELFQTDHNININIPVFRISGTQLSPEQVVTTRKIALERIHVEHTIRKLKSYRILLSRIPIASLGIMEQVYTVCVLLCNFKYGLDLSKIISSSAARV